MIRVLALALACLLLAGCGGAKDTPPEVLAAYDQLRSQLNQDLPGESVHKLEEFKKTQAQYRITATVDEEIARWRAQASGRFHLARELVRGGELERAERMVRDLATYFPDTDDGRMASQFLQFDFYMVKANQLMAVRRYGEVEQTMRELLAKKPTPEQAAMAERVLDSVHAARLVSVENACQQLRLLLLQVFAETGRYPLALTLETLSLGSTVSQHEIQDALSAIESYRTQGDTFSLVVVGKDGKTRRRVTERGIDAG